MKKKTRTPPPLPDVNIFTSVSYDVWRSLVLISAFSDVGRIELYALALKWAVKDEAFRDHVLDIMDARRAEVKK